MFASFVEILSQFYYPILIVVASYFLILSLVNQYEMRHFALPSEIIDGPLVSVLIPTRNEEKNIELCLKSLQNQQYKNFEILVLNDNSEDNTLNIINRFSAEDSRIKVLDGDPLPPDWYGKPFAMYQLSKQAKGEILIFTDADTVHKPTSISWAVTNLLGLKADLVSGFIGQTLGSIGEILTVPLMFCLTGFIIPLSINRYVKKFRYFSAAIGQFIVIRRSVFDAIGGCEAFKEKTSEDILMSRLVKRKGYKTCFLNICDYVKCRMYDGFMPAVEGIGRSIFNFLGRRNYLFLILMIIVFFILFFPFLLLFICIAKSSPWTLYILTVVVLYTLTWIFTFLGMKLNWLYGFLWPLLFLSFLYIGLLIWFRNVSGKDFVWKGRKVT